MNMVCSGYIALKDTSSEPRAVSWLLPRRGKKYACV